MAKKGCVICANAARAGVPTFMQKAAFYREQAERARRLARPITNGEAERLLLGMAQEYEDLATDLETGAVEIRHPELLSGRQRSGGA
jgi:hypothetical protein